MTLYDAVTIRHCFASLENYIPVSRLLSQNNMSQCIRIYVNDESEQNSIHRPYLPNIDPFNMC